MPCRYPEKWVVDCTSVGSAEPALIYLGRYLYRGVIAEKDIVACDHGQVSFRYRNAKTGRMELQHVLPKGFRRARNFGFLHPNCKRLIALLHLLLKFTPARALAWVTARAPILCAACGAVMVIVRTRIRSAGVMPAPIVTRECFDFVSVTLIRWTSQKRGRRAHLCGREPDFGFAVSVSQAAIAPSTAPIKAVRDAPSPARTPRPWMIVA